VADEKAAPAAWVTVTSGDLVEILRHGNTIKPSIGTEVLVNDEIRTGKKSGVTIQFADNSVITVAEQSSMELTEWYFNETEKTNRISTRLKKGRMRGFLNGLSKDNSKMTVETKMIIAGIKGSEMSVWEEEESGDVGVAVHEGSGFVEALGEKMQVARMVDAGHMLTAKTGEVLMGPVKITATALKELNKLIIIRKDDLIKLLKAGAKVVYKGGELIVQGGAVVGEVALNGVKKVSETAANTASEVIETTVDMASGVKRVAGDVLGSGDKDALGTAPLKGMKAGAALARGYEQKVD